MEMTKANRRLVASLATVKGRREHGLFMAEGTRCVLETVALFDVVALLATAPWLDLNGGQLPTGISDVTIVKRSDIIEMSSMSTPPDVIAIYRIPECKASRPTPDTLSLALDRIQDPGNLGTIVRIASWMGIRNIYCSIDTVDLYNPKVVQSTMGAIARVSVSYCNLPALLDEARRNSVAVYGTFLDGYNIYNTSISEGGIIVMGNEGHGISDAVAANVDHRLLIPSYPPGEPCVESLNVSMATAIVTAEFRRRSANKQMTTGQ